MAGFRRATADDADAIVATLSGAFAADPLWSWAFPDSDKRPGQYATWFGLFVESGLPNGWVWVADQGAAVTVWAPPGRKELSDEAEARVEPFLKAELGAHAEPVLETMGRFDAAQPKAERFYYLSWLGTHPDHRGRGIGMELLRANLALIDEEGMPAYLESSNPANDVRYESLGFEPRTAFSTPGGEHTVTTMWRAPGGAG